jgi:hypothetical protein
VKVKPIASAKRSRREKLRFAGIEEKTMQYPHHEFQASAAPLFQQAAHLRRRVFSRFLLK